MVLQKKSPKKVNDTPVAERSSETKAEKPKKVKKLSKKDLIFIISGTICLLLGVAAIVAAIILPNKTEEELDFEDSFNKNGGADKNYSVLTGLELPEGAAKDAPIYCIQTPNGTDGARPQSGLTEAGVVFEAIAEAGITRFAAIYQNPTSAVIGPIRSLRIYYLQWDTPFDCTIVHAGGSGDALAAVAAGGYKDLSEDYAYMYRGTYGSRLWNNLFTTAKYLREYSANTGYTTSNAKGFARLTPAESAKQRIDDTANEKLEITAATDKDTSSTSPKVSHINFNYGYSAFNVVYDYDAATNTYRRSYGDGTAHNVYECTSEDLGEKNPEDVCSLTQLSPSVVIAMVVQEGRASDNYHEDITTTGSGNAYIFQNGVAIEGTWSKPTVDSQISFIDKNGNEIRLAPGQTFVSAVPAYGSIEY